MKSNRACVGSHATNLRVNAPVEVAIFTRIAEASSGASRVMPNTAAGAGTGVGAGAGVGAGGAGCCSAFSSCSCSSLCAAWKAEVALQILLRGTHLPRTPLEAQNCKLERNCPSRSFYSWGGPKESNQSRVAPPANMYIYIYVYRLFVLTVFEMLT